MGRKLIKETKKASAVEPSIIARKPPKFYEIKSLPRNYASGDKELLELAESLVDEVYQLNLLPEEIRSFVKKYRVGELIEAIYGELIKYRQHSLGHLEDGEGAPKERDGRNWVMIGAGFYLIDQEKTVIRFLEEGESPSIPQEMSEKARETLYSFFRRRLAEQEEN